MLEDWTCHCGQRNRGSGPCTSCLNAAPPSGETATDAATGPSNDRPWAKRALAVAVAVLLVSGVASAVLVRNRQTESSTVAAESGKGKTSGGTAADAEPSGARTIEVTPDQQPPAGASEAERLIPGLMRFVQEKRGLAFKAPVRIALLDDAAFRKQLQNEEVAAEEKEEARKELLTTSRVLEGLGLLEKGIDLEKAVESLYSDAVTGRYNFVSDELMVRGEKLTPGVRATVVHELTHALQDQHFDIDRDDLDERDDEAAQGFSGLVEGDAVRVEELYLESLSNREQKEAEREEAEAAGGIDPELPRVLLQLVAFPYIIGPEFTRAVVEGGGQPALDRAFAEPPSTSEHLLHPESFLSGQPIVTVETPKADGEVIDQGVLGELGLLLVLGAGGASDGAAAKGWGGDRYVAWRDGKKTCVRTTMAMDTLQDDAQLRRALDAIADDRAGFTVEGKGPITFTSCG